MTEQSFIDALIELRPLRGCGLSPVPSVNHSLAKKLPFLLNRRLSLLPVAKELPSRLYGQVVESQVDQVRPIYSIVNGGYLISDNFKSLVEAEPCQRIEYIPVDLFRTESESLIEGQALGSPVAEQYWLMNCYNNFDILDREQTIGQWYQPTDHEVNRSKGLFALGDPPELYQEKCVTLTSIPKDPIFGVVGLPQKRFVSETLFDQVVTKGITEEAWRGLFRRYSLVRTETGLGGLEAGQTKATAKPFRLNGRVIYWGNFNQPLKFGQSQNEQTIGDDGRSIRTVK